MRRSARWTLAASAAAACASLLVFACSSSDPAGDLDSGVVADGSNEAFVNYDYDLDSSYDGPDYARVRLMNDGCLSGPFTIDDAGFVPCHMILFFPAEFHPGGVRCADLGLPEAVKSDGDYLEAYSAANGVPLPLGSFCGLEQEALNTCIMHDAAVPLDDAGSDADADAAPPPVDPAWCYVFGHGCREDASCNEALCTTDSYETDPNTYAWLACP